MRRRNKGQNGNPARPSAKATETRVVATSNDARVAPPRPATAAGTELLTNACLAELLAREADQFKPPLTRAFRRASRRAFLWPEEAADLIRSGRSLTELQGIGPYLEKVINTWLADPPPDLIRRCCARTS